MMRHLILGGTLIMLLATPSMARGPARAVGPTGNAPRGIVRAGCAGAARGVRREGTALALGAHGTANARAAGARAQVALGAAGESAGANGASPWTPTATWCRAGRMDGCRSVGYGRRDRLLDRWQPRRADRRPGREPATQAPYAVAATGCVDRLDVSRREAARGSRRCSDGGTLEPTSCSIR
jgi:hypothetical protein